MSSSINSFYCSPTQTYKYIFQMPYHLFTMYQIISLPVKMAECLLTSWPAMWLGSASLRSQSQRCTSVTDQWPRDTKWSEIVQHWPKSQLWPLTHDLKNLISPSSNWCLPVCSLVNCEMKGGNRQTLSQRNATHQHARHQQKETRKR